MTHQSAKMDRLSKIHKRNQIQVMDVAEIQPLHCCRCTAELQNRSAEDTCSLQTHPQWWHPGNTAGTGGSDCRCHRMAVVLGLFALESWW